MQAMTSMVNRVLGKWGLKIARTPRAGDSGPYSALFHNCRVTDLDSLVKLADTIPGMLTEESGKFLFALCYMQQLAGDVVEIGSWQGYSTSFLARAVAEAGKGRMYAIDHFRGNPGKESFYVAAKPDLSDLPERFQNNMLRLDLAQTVTLLSMPNSKAAEQLQREGVKIRFLFIDGDHTKEGVQRDVDLFFPLLMKGSIVVFDDCSPSAPGVIQVADDLLRRKVCEKAFAYSNTLVVML